MLTIRLSRIGKKKKPMYRLVISEKARDPYGRALEILGTYNPFSKDLQAKKDRIEYWLSQGAGMSATVNNLLITKEIIKGDKVRAYKPKKKEKKEGEGETKPAGNAGAPTAPKAEEAKPAEVKTEPVEETPAETAKPAETEPEEKTAEVPAAKDEPKPEEPKAAAAEEKKE